MPIRELQTNIFAQKGCVVNFVSWLEIGAHFLYCALYENAIVKESHARKIPFLNLFPSFEFEFFLKKKQWERSKTNINFILFSSIYSLKKSNDNENI